MDWRNAPVCPPQGVQSAGYPTRLYPETRQAGEAPTGRTDCIRPGAAAQHGRGAVRHIRAGFLTVLIWRTTRPRCPSRSGDPQRGDRWQKGGMGARGGFEELLRKSRPRLAPPVRATPRRGSAPDQSDPALVESRGIGGRSGDPERDGDATRWLDHPSNNLAKLPFDLSMKVPRTRLRPCYGDGFDRAPLTVRRPRGEGRAGGGGPGAGAARVAGAPLPGRDKQIPPLRVRVSHEPPRYSSRWLAEAFERL